MVRETPFLLRQFKYLVNSDQYEGEISVDGEYFPLIKQVDRPFSGVLTDYDTHSDMVLYNSYYYGIDKLTIDDI